MSGDNLFMLCNQSRGWTLHNVHSVCEIKFYKICIKVKPDKKEDKHNFQFLGFDVTIELVVNRNQHTSTT